jgi:hypothetical protein
MNRTEIQALKNRRLFAKQRSGKGEGLFFWLSLAGTSAALYLILIFIMGAF